MARKKKAAAPLDGAAEFAGPDATKEAMDKIAAARQAAETEKAQDGDNGGPIMDEEAWKRATVQLTAETIELEGLSEKVAEVRGRISSIKKVAEKCGVDWDVVKAKVKLDRRVAKGEMGAIVTEQRRLGSLMRLMESPLYTQFGLFAELPEDKPEEEGGRPGMDAELQGQHAYSNNEPLTSNPFPPGTQEHVDWGTGWRNAQTANARKMAPGANAEAAAGPATTVN
jgi:hypothetical protein